jgi:hypothetical protein
MFAKVCSAAANGIEAYPVEVEVNLGFGDSLIVIVVNITPKPFSSADFWSVSVHTRGITTNGCGRISQCTRKSSHFTTLTTTKRTMGK